MKLLRNMILLFLPIVLMIGINEVFRTQIKNNTYSIYGSATINPADKNTEKCTWECHNNTAFCKKNHIRLLKNYTETTDTVYFGVINLLAKSGDYVFANIIFLVFLFPLLIWFFITKSLSIQKKINKQKKNR